MPLQISVVPDEKIAGAFGGTLAYKVITRGILNFPDGKSERIRTRKDFVWLAHMLKTDCPGTAIPKLPAPVALNKHEFLGRFKEEGVPAELLEQKAASFEKYLMKISAHETLSTNEHFKLFLQCEDEEFAEASNESEPPVEKVKQALNWVDVRLTLAWKHLTEKKPGEDGFEEADPQEASPSDAKMEGPAQYIMEVDGKLTALSKGINYMVSKSKLANDKLSEFSEAALELGEFESSAELKNLAGATEALAVSTNDYFDKVKTNFIDPLDDLVEELACVKAAMMDQKTARHKWALARKNLEKKTRGHESLAKKLEDERAAGGPAAAEKPAEDVVCDVRKLPPACANMISPIIDDEAVTNAELAIHDANAELELCESNLEKVTACVCKEIEKFKATKSGELSKMIKAYASVQVEMCDKQKAEWLKV